MSRQYKVCSFCNSHLDFGEKCDCKRENEKKIKNIKKLLQVDLATNQFAFCFEEDKSEKKKDKHKLCCE